MGEPARKKREVKDGGQIKVVELALDSHDQPIKIVKEIIPGAEERSVSLKHLLDARRSEVLLFEERFRKTSGGVHGGDGHQKRAFQLLPRHMRRRAMSYNPYLVPLRLRDRAKRESEQTEAPHGYHFFNGGGWRKSRKRIGNRRLDIVRPGPQPTLEARKAQHKDFFENHKFHVLETHLWHAKRFHMVNYGGYKIPMQATLRGTRAILQTVKKGVLAIDTSHTQVIALTSRSLPSLEFLLEELSLNAKHLLMPFQLRRLHSCFLKRRVTFDSKSIDNATHTYSTFTPMAPCQIHGAQLASTGETRLFIRLDPHAVTDVVSEITNIISRYKPSFKTSSPAIDVQVSMESLQNRFEFYGPKSGEALQKVLHPVDNADKSALAKFLSNRPKCVPAGTTLVVRVKDPRITRYATRFEAQTAAPKKDSASEYSLTSMLSNLVLHGGRNGRKDDFSKEVASSSAIDACPLFTGQFDWCKFLDHETEDIKKLEKVATESSTFIVLQRFPEGEDGHEGWILTVPMSWGSSFWKRIVRCGVRPIGRREWKNLKFENLQPCFPDDFPGTEAYSSYEIEKGHELSARWNRRPKQKRLNFHKLGFPSPFRPDWYLLFMNAAQKYQQMSNLSHRILFTYQFGKTSQKPAEKKIFSHEWIQDANHHRQLWLSPAKSLHGLHATSTDTKIRHILLELIPVILICEDGGVVPSYNAHIYLGKNGSAKEHQDLPVGFVTTSAFCLARGKACSIAFISRQALVSSPYQLPSTVFVRNTTSRMHHRCSLLEMEDSFF